MAEPSVRTPTEEDDGFGDFVPPSKVDTARLAEPSVSTPPEEDGGFGDFDAAPPSSVVATQPSSASAAPPSTATAAPPSDALAQTLRSALAPRGVEPAESVQTIYDVEGRLVSAADLLVSKYARTPDERAARLVAVRHTCGADVRQDMLVNTTTVPYSPASLGIGGDVSHSVTICICILTDKPIQ